MSDLQTEMQYKFQRQKKDNAAPAYTLRKSSGLRNRKGLPLKYSPNKVIIDEEFLLQVPQK